MTQETLIEDWRSKTEKRRNSIKGLLSSRLPLGDDFCLGNSESQCRIHFRVIPTEGEAAKIFYPPTPLDHQLRAVGSDGGIFSQALLVCPEHGPTRQSHRCL